MDTKQPLKSLLVQFIFQRLLKNPVYTLLYNDIL